jgi:DNA-directed RNA polymerase specialized sigma24 family protein
MSKEYRGAPPDNRTATRKRIPGQKREEDMASEPMDFAEFYASAKDDCLRAVLASTGDLPAAEDLVAEAFARAWAAWRKVSGHPSPRAWVVRTALNTRVSWWRRRHREVALGQADGLAAVTGGGDGDPVDTQLMASVARLPLRQRQVVGLRLFLDLDTARTAEVLGIAPGTVTAHMARAMAALREEFTSARGQEKR